MIKVEQYVRYQANETAMRCFFHLIGDNQTVIDNEGVVGDDLEQAWSGAIAAIEEFLHDSTRSGVDWSGLRLEIFDQSRLTHAMLHFDQLRQPKRTVPSSQ
ncbi:hypothetical protein OIU35_32750 [Boseaceae bacterium BT-24-1]|nr:hypothetical protein [Boseaceae bacterium BT-24-1]